jgi:hypothetical protein
LGSPAKAIIVSVAQYLRGIGAQHPDLNVCRWDVVVAVAYQKDLPPLYNSSHEAPWREHYPENIPLSPNFPGDIMLGSGAVEFPECLTRYVWMHRNFAGVHYVQARSPDPFTPANLK